MSERDRASVIKLVDEDRRYWLQACIARVMKKMRQASFNDLVTQIKVEAGRRFQPTIPMIKKSVESLLEKSFIERKEGSPDCYLYVAWSNVVTKKTKIKKRFILVSRPVLSNPEEW